ncbi:hypothetical protein TOPH_09160 [Tolypocladium ophioglossoides CBS 100239]|uniref:PD-(D/E)XK nuclease-like domain-containing protein n=1 Tax=Tolypocladium ophioglossoides (strain CBS 100239) TaxID=1163406 RepID=A0A0L0MWC1_TOLOC|nr:hypothetical protein TOPH_09160 [Tolypocladium ophioglossoides CBS 100239]
MSVPRGESPSKRQNPSDDETPRASHHKRIQTPGSESSYSLSDQSRRSFQSSERSGRLSPQKHMRTLKLNPKGVKFGDLSHSDDKPPSLEALLETVDVIMEGRGIVATSAREALTLAARSHKDLKWACRGGDYFSDSPDIVGCTPPPEAVLSVMAAAAECSTCGHPEANWNLEVHQRVLELAFRPQGQSITTAAIMPEYGTPSPSKKVDFCIYIEPEIDFSWASTSPSSIASFRDTLPGRVFNFTDFVPLDQRPIALSIESKKPSEGFDSAKLQLGVWQMAHWAFLRHLVEKRSAQVKAADCAVDARSYGLPIFIPGIIIQGHDWHLIITTLEGQQTLFWQKVVIGSTSSSKGIYQIIRTLHILRQWASDTYWPWLRDLILQGRGGCGGCGFAERLQ